MTKGEWLKQEGIHVYKALFNYDEEVDDEWINDWKLIRDSISQIAADESCKQTPQKPVVKRLEFCIQYECPRCNSYIGNLGSGGKYGIQKYCSNCGQRIDFSGGDEDE